MAERPDSGQERTEEATPRRRERAAAEGQIARSVELSSALMLTGGTLALVTLAGPSLGRYVSRLFAECAGALAMGPVGVGDAVSLLRAAALGLVVALLPFGAALVSLAVAIQLLQTRGAIAWKRVMPDPSHLDPVGNLRRLVGPESLVQLLRSVLKVGLIGGVAALTLARLAPELMSLGSLAPGQLLEPTRHAMTRLLLDAGMVFVGIGVADYGWQWFRHQRSLRMTRQELIEEHRESEGDPRVKARMRSIAAARARRRMFQQVPTADVVVVNPTHIAVALKYDPARAPAPVVVAMGQRKIAERIRALATAANVPVIENRPVARALFATTQVGQMVPPALYAAVAEILAFVFRRRAGDPARLLAAARSRS
ncbi:MAG TPA: EscU/YscU/HrcU family type III secretion system export apparatus switch protein [Dongiaceae bacterium]|nr:EscU/YscU/HrcU family type III secretion system export apparatus switch protein [Dongiaceae bacterium]